MEAIDFLNLDVVRSKSDSDAKVCLTDESYHRLVFAAKRYQDFWTKKRQEMLQNREQDEDAVNDFIDSVFNNPDFWGGVSNRFG